MGRLQVVSTQPLIILDVAHNAESATALAEHIQSLSHKGAVRAVFSTLADKQLSEIAAPFINIVDDWHVATLNTSRSASAANIANYFTYEHSKHSHQYASIEDAFRQVRQSSKQDDLVICFGSFYVVEACLGAL